MQRRNLLILAGMGTVGLAGCTGSGEDDSESTPGESGDDSDTDNGTAEDGDDEPSGPPAPDDMLQTHAQALENAGSFTVEMDGKVETYSEPEDTEGDPRIAHTGTFYVEYVYDDNVGLYEDLQAEEFEGNTDDMLLGRYRTPETAFKKGPTGDVEEDENTDIPYEYGEIIELPFTNRYAFSLEEMLGAYSEVGGTNYNGKTVTEYVATGPEGIDSEYRNFKKFDSTMYVNEDGAVVYIEFTHEQEDASSDWIKTEGTVEFTDISGIDVTTPDWYEGGDE